MLVLSRKLNESLVVGENIIITILSVEHDQVKLGIEAPRDIPIVRHELFVAVKEQSIIENQLTIGPAPETFENLRTVLIQLTEPNENNPDKETEITPETVDAVLNPVEKVLETKKATSKKKGRGKIRAVQTGKK